MPTLVKVFLLIFFNGLVLIYGCLSCSSKSISTAKTPNLESPGMVLDASIYKKVDFIDNSSEKIPYLSLTVFFDSVRSLRTQLENKEKLTLLNRGEAHITLLTPSEWLQVTKFVPAKLVTELAFLNRVQDIPFQAVCIGRGIKVENQKSLSTYFIVVDSPKLTEFRRSIQSVYVARGGQMVDFDPDNFQPHITIGFSVRDLHSQDGVVKTKASCIRQIQIQ